MTRIRLRTTRRTANTPTILGVLAAGVLLTHVPLDAQVKTRRFLRPSTTTGDVVYRPQSIVKGLCDRVVGLREFVPCPPSLSGRVPARAFLPPPVIAADLPHLRMDLVLKRIENKVVSGLGVGNLEPPPPFYAPAVWCEGPCQRPVEPSCTTSTAPRTPTASCCDRVDS